MGVLPGPQLGIVAHRDRRVELSADRGTHRAVASGPQGSARINAVLSMGGFRYRVESLGRGSRICRLNFTDPDQSSANTARMALSNARVSSLVRRPANRPSRTSGSIALNCSTRMRVLDPSIVISGRKEVARRPVDVGATIHVDSGRSSDCTTTA